MKYTLVALVFSFSILQINTVFCQQIPGSQEITIDNANDQIYKDSLGNLMTHKEALALLRTGKYVSVPVMKGMGQMEITIKIPNKAEKEKHQTYHGSKTVLTTTGVKRIETKFHMDDSIPPIKAYSISGESISLNQDDLNKKTVLMFLKENTRWDDTEPLFAKLLTDYSSVSFVVCPADGKKKLKYFFSESTLASSKNLLLADSEFNSSMAIKDFPTYMIIDNQRKVLLLIPPLPKKEFAISALQAFLNRNN